MVGWGGVSHRQVDLSAGVLALVCKPRTGGWEEVREGLLGTGACWPGSLVKLLSSWFGERLERKGREPLVSGLHAHTHINMRTHTHTQR